MALLSREREAEELAEALSEDTEEREEIPEELLEMIIDSFSKLAPGQMEEVIFQL